jgi:hypothetical protein
MSVTGDLDSREDSTNVWLYIYSADKESETERWQGR